jgi:hypothetical protein
MQRIQALFGPSSLCTSLHIRHAMLLCVHGLQAKQVHCVQGQCSWWP